MVMKMNKGPLPKGPIFDHVKEVMKQRLAAMPPEPQKDKFTEQQLIDRFAKFVKESLKHRQYTYDPTLGKFYFRYHNPFDLFQEATSGAKAYDVLREYFIKEEQWDDVVFINWRTGVGEGGIELTSQHLTAFAVQTSK